MREGRGSAMGCPRHDVHVSGEIAAAVCVARGGGGGGGGSVCGGAGAASAAGWMLAKKGSTGRPLPTP